MGKSASKIPILQNVYFELAENLQAYFSLIVEISAAFFVKSQSRVLYEFFKFSIFPTSFLDRFLNYDASSPKCSKKNIQKKHSQCKIFRSIK